MAEDYDPLREIGMDDVGATTDVARPPSTPQLPTEHRRRRTSSASSGAGELIPDEPFSTQSPAQPWWKRGWVCVGASIVMGLVVGALSLLRLFAGPSETGEPDKKKIIFQSIVVFVIIALGGSLVSRFAIGWTKF